MTDAPEQLAGRETAAEEQSLDSWTQATEAPTWTSIDVDVDTAAKEDSVTDTTTTHQGSPVAATDRAARFRRPTSLRGDTPAPDETRDPVFATEPRSVPDGAQDTEPPAGPGVAERVGTLTNEHPEILLGVAFIGGLLLATIVKRLGR